MQKSLIKKIIAIGISILLLPNMIAIADEVDLSENNEKLDSQLLINFEESREKPPEKSRDLTVIEKDSLDYYDFGGDVTIIYDDDPPNIHLGWDSWITYMINIGYSSIESSLIVGGRFRDTGLWGCGGPDFIIYNWNTGDYQFIENIGEWDNYNWWDKTYTNSDAYISDTGNILFGFYTRWGDNTMIDKVRVRFTEPPDDPTNLIAYDATTTSISLSWNKGVDADDTLIKRKVGSFPSNPYDGETAYYGQGEFTIDVDLSPETIYFYRAWSYDDESGLYSYGYSEVINSTLPITLPNILTLNATDIGDFSAEINSYLIDDGGWICEHAIKYREIGNTWIFTNWSGNYHSGQNISKYPEESLHPDTLYEFTAGVKNPAGESWGEILNFTTTNEGSPQIDRLEPYYADGSSETYNGFLIKGMNLPINYTAIVYGDTIDIVQFKFGNRYFNDTNGADGWHASFDCSDIIDVNETIKVRGYNITHDWWGNYKIYDPDIIEIDQWFELYLSYISSHANSPFVEYSIETAQPETDYNNFWILHAEIDLSLGSPDNPAEPPVAAEVPGGVPVENLGGEYGFAGGVGSVLRINSESNQIDVSGGFDAHVSAHGFGAGIGAVLGGHLEIQNSSIIWDDMYIILNGDITVPVFYIPLSICGYGFEAGVTITPHVELQFNLEPTSDPNEGIIPGLGIKLKDDGGIEGDVGCTVRAFIDLDLEIVKFYVEASGDATLYFKTPADADGYFEDFILSARIGGKIVLFGWEREGWWHYQWSYRDGRSLGKEYNESSWSLLERDYQHPDQNVYNNPVWDGSNNTGTIIENVYPYANPSVAYNPSQSRGNEVMMVWAHDDIGKPIVQGMELKYCIWNENGQITTIESINPTHLNDSRMQTDPHIAYDKNGNVVCVFSQLDETINENSTFAETLAKAEISYCVWNSSTGIWGEDILPISANNVLDANPILSSNSQGDVILLWIQDEDVNLSTANDRSIFASYWNGIGWSDPLTIVDSTSIISGPSIGINEDGDGLCAFSSEIDSVQNIFYVPFRTNGSGDIQQFTFDYDFNDTAPSVITGITGNFYITWLKHKYIYQNNERIYDGNIFYDEISQDRPGQAILIANGSVSDPIAFESPSVGRANSDFAVGWKSGQNANQLHYAQINLGGRESRSIERSDNMIYQSDRKLSDISWTFGDGFVSAALIERQNLTNGGKNCNLTFIYHNTLDNLPPFTPDNPIPADGVQDIEAGNILLEWTGGDPDSDDVLYDVYFSDTDPPSIIEQGISNLSYPVYGIVNGTIYYWKVVAHDSYSHTTVGPIWSFSTANIPPTADAGGPYTAAPNEEITFDGSGSTDPENSTIVYRWDFNYDGIYDTEFTSDPTATFTFSEEGSYDITLQVRDAGLLFDTNDAIVTIIRPNIPPTAPEVTGVTIGLVDTEYPYTVVSTDEDNDTIQYIINWDDDNTSITEFLPSGTPFSINHSWSVEGSYIISVQANDNKSYSDTTELPVAIYDELPSHMGIIPSSDTVNVGEDSTVTIYIDPVEPIGGWGIWQLNFTQGIANATEATPGTYWETFFDPGDIDNDAGTITDIQSFTMGPYPDSNHTACIINFTALQPGTCTFEIASVNITNGTFENIPVITQPAVITIVDNMPPLIYDEYPQNESIDIERPPDELNVTIEDPNDDAMDVYIRWKIPCECCIQNSDCCYSYNDTWITVKTFTGIGNGIYEFIPLDDMTIWLNDWIWGNTTYIWSVNVTDGTFWTNETYQYTTGGSRYDVNNNDLVNFQDAGLVWIHRTSEVCYDGIYDVNSDGQVNFQDAGLTWINRD